MERKIEADGETAMPSQFAASRTSFFLMSSISSAISMPLVQ